MDLAEASELLGSGGRGVLITIKRDGRPQASNIAYAHIDGEILVSVTADRAKTRNVARDPRASLHVTTPDFGRWVVVEGDVELAPVTVEPGDEAGRALLEVYETVRGEPHPDPVEFFDAMVRDRHQLIRLRPGRAYGQL